MTDAVLAQLERENVERRERKQAATPGPWEDAPQMKSAIPAIAHPDDEGWQGIAYAWHPGNRQFIAAARNDPVENVIDVLLAEVRRLKALVGTDLTPS